MAELAEIHEFHELVAALKARMHELNITMDTLDAIAGLPCRFSAKILAKKPLKGLGPISLGAIIGALGLKLIVVEDEEALSLVRSRLTKRKSPPVLDAPSIILTRTFFRRIGRLGASARNEKMPPERRSEFRTQSCTGAMAITGAGLTGSPARCASATATYGNGMSAIGISYEFLAR
jgi:hypothetical protein